MEKQKFLMEVTELARGAVDNSLLQITIGLVKELIRSAARQGHKEVQLYARFNVNIDITGLNVMTLPIASTIPYFVDEGFDAINQPNGYVRIAWE